MNNPKVEKQKPVPPFVQFCCAAIPQVFDDSLSYYEALCAMWKYLDETVKVINNNAMITEDFIAKVNELHDYVENYFNNLDVQEEINNKLDQMAEDGTLQEIVADYLQANVTWTFDTVADMKEATNLTAGSYARTLGFHTLNDGGGAIYYITDSGTADEMEVIAVGSLYANLANIGNVNVKQFGAYGDGTTDDTDAIQGAFSSTHKVIEFPEGTYLVKVDTNDAPLTDTTDVSKCGLLISSEKVLLGEGAIIKSYHETLESSDLYAISASAKVKIDGLTFNGQYSDYHYTYGIQLNSSDNTIRNCSFINMGSSGIVLNGSSTNNINRTIVENCRFQNCGNSIFGAWVNDSSFTNIQFFNVAEGFDFDKKSTNVVIDNIIANGYRGAGADACVEINGCENFTVSNVTCKNFIDGILINGKVIHNEGLELETISKNITVSNCLFDTITGYGVVFGNAVEDVDECVDIVLDNIIVKSATYDGFHIRGNNIKITNCIAETCGYTGILIDTKAKNITIDNFTNAGCTKGLINCTIGENIVLTNIYDNEANNTSNLVTISGVTNLVIDDLIVANTDSFVTSNHRLFYINVTNASFNNITMPVEDNAIFFVTASTIYTISNSTLPLNSLKINKPTVLISDIVPSTLGTSMRFATGTLAIVNEGISTTNIYLCVRGNMAGGSTVTWKKITTEAIE